MTALKLYLNVLISGTTCWRHGYLGGWYLFKDAAKITAVNRSIYFAIYVYGGSRLD